MTQRPLVAVLFGGRSSEHSVSCVTAAGVMNEIDSNAFRLLPAGQRPQPPEQAALAPALTLAVLAIAVAGGRRVLAHLRPPLARDWAGRGGA